MHGKPQGIWSSPSLADTNVPLERRLTLGEAGTALQSVSIDACELLLKREDLAPTGSHKDRAAAFQIAQAAAGDVPAVVISSSGNAAIATSRYAELHDMPAIVCVHPDTDTDKLAAIDGSTTVVVITERAINAATRISRAWQMPNLRPSTDDAALAGFGTLADELRDHAIDDVVLFATSGGTALAVAQGLVDASIRVHFVQGEGNAWMVEDADVPGSSEARTAAAGRLGVRQSRRADSLRSATAATGGRGHVASAAAIATAHQLLRDAAVNVSDESAANLAVSLELSRAGSGRVACVISGAPPAVRGREPARILVATDEWDAIGQLALHMPFLGEPVVPQRGGQAVNSPRSAAGN